MEVEETTEIADEVSIPATSEESQTEILESGEDDKNTPEPTTDERNSGFRSLFEQARNAASRQDAEITEEETVSEPVADAKIPVEEKEAVETEETAGEEEPKEEETKEAKKTSRSEGYRKMETERDEALAKSTEIETRLTKIDQQFEKFGGVEVVETALELYELAADKTKATDFVAKINSLPHKAAIQKEIFENVLDLPANRVYGINRVLREDFGLESNLNQPVLEKILEFVAARYNTDSAEFEGFLDRELELLAEPESELEKLRKENAALKSPKEQKEESVTTESEQEFASRIQRTYNDFEDSAFSQVSETELKKFGFAINPNDSEMMKKAKTRIAEATKFAVAVEMREAKAHESLLDYWIEKTPEDNKFYSQAAKTYRKAMTLKTQKFLEDISPILGALKQHETKTTPSQTITETATAKGNSNLPLPKKTETKALGFSGAFSQARKQVGQS